MAKVSGLSADQLLEEFACQHDISVEEAKRLVEKHGSKEKTSHDAHAELGGSSAPRWTRCPGSRVMLQGRSSGTTDFAVEGTLAHGLGEFCLKKGISTYEAVEQGFTFDVADKNQEPDYRVPDAEMCEYVQQYVDRCNDSVGDSFIEPRVSFEPWVPGWGYIDFLNFNPYNYIMTIRDLKYGLGNKVEAEENEQLLLYAIGAIEEYGYLYDVKRVVMEIDQPRLDHVSSWKIDYDELMRRAVWFRERADEAMKDNAPLVPGEKQCLWCNAKADCKALADLTFQTVSQEFDEVSDELKVKDSRILTLEQKASILKHKKLITDFLSAVETSALDDELNGRDVPGFKVVSGRSIRQWGVSEDEVIDTLSLTVSEEELFTRKIISPTQAEKIIGKKNFTDFEYLVVKPEGKPTLVPDDDKRPSLCSVNDEFDLED